MAAADLVEILSSEDPEMKVAALLRCADAGRLEAPERLCECLSDQDALVRGAAARAFSAAGDQAGSLAGKVSQLLTSSDAGARCAAAEALGALAPGAAPHASALAALLEDPEEDKVAGALMAGGCATAGDVGRTKAAWRFPRAAAAEALPKLGAEGRAFAPAVARLLRDAVPEVRCVAATSLGAMSVEGAAHEKAVLELLTTERDPRVIASLTTALAEMAKVKGCPDSTTMDTILRLLSSQHPGVRAAAATALGLLGDAGSAHIAKLLKCLTDRSPQVKMAAIQSIVGFGPAGQVYAVDLCRLAFDEWQMPAVRAAALDALPQFGERGAALADEVAELVEDSDEEVRLACIRALEKFQHQAAE